jgi:hypothetical protein
VSSSDVVPSGVASTRYFQYLLCYSNTLTRNQHVISYPISPTVINILLFETVPGGLGKPLDGPKVSTAPREDVIELYRNWEEDLRAVTSVCFLE